MLFFVSADNGGPVARGKEPFLCSFLDIEISKFRKDLLLFFFVISWIWFLGKIRLWRKCSVYKTTSSTRLNCNCQHSCEQKILLKLIRKRSFEILKSFHTFKKMDPRILSNSERFLLQKNLQNDELTNYLLARLKLQDR